MMPEQQDHGKKQKRLRLRDTARPHLFEAGCYGCAMAVTEAKAGPENVRWDTNGVQKHLENLANRSTEQLI
jgi:hypothetical protein